MAKEYIEREAAKRELLSWAVCMNHPEYLMRDDAMHIIDSFPAADVAPVRHGRWIFGKDLPYSWGQIIKNKYHLYCSECLEQAFNRSENNDPDFDMDTPYCPVCGCRMDGGAD